MNIRIIAVGKLGLSFLKEGFQEYAKRLQKYASLEVIEVKEDKGASKGNPKDIELSLDKEGEQLAKHIKDSDYVFLLDVYGKSYSSEDFAAQMSALTLRGHSTFTFVIGGPFGFSKALEKRAQERLSFSSFTFTHQMVRLLLIEQIYRAFKINNHEPYHW